MPRADSSAPVYTQGRKKRSLPMRIGEKAQEVLRDGGVTGAAAGTVESSR